MGRKIIPNILLVLIFILISLYWFIPLEYYNAEYFGIEQLVSSIDYDQDGIDDYMDIMLGARIDAENHPKYDDSYVSGGYPSSNVGVCSDVIWRAFKNAGYMLKDMIDEDIRNNPNDYPRVSKPDPNIDFRRVKNLKVFFDKYAESLTLDPYEISSWQPGDIVIFEENYNHIGIISDRRNSKGIPYLIHNAGQLNREEDALLKYSNMSKITGHYRWNGGYYDSIR